MALQVVTLDHLAAPFSGYQRRLWSSSMLTSPTAVLFCVSVLGQQWGSSGGSAWWK